MESIQSAMKEWKGNVNVQARLEKMKQALLSDAKIQAFIQKNKITNDMIEQGLVKLYEFKKEQNHCTNCKGLISCPNMMKGYQPEIVNVRGALDLHYHPCPLLEEEENQKRQRELMKSLYIPKDILDAKFESLDPDEARDKASRKALSFALQARPGEDGQGLYFYGKFGVGKTHIMGAVMNALRARDIDSFIVYTPDFFREMRQSIGDGTFQEKLDMVKEAKVLILDDIGAETITSWIRDDVLGVILQHRMLEKLPTLFTSNYDYEELEEHLAYSDRGGIEELKAKRIMERIKHFTTFVTVEGKNRRRKS